MTIPIMEAALGLAAFGFLCQALEIRWHIGRLTMQPGWLGFTVWGMLAALRASGGDSESALSPPSNALLIGGGFLVAAAFVTVLVTQRTKHALSEIHTIVNNQSDKQIERISQLTESLQAAGVKVPARKGDPEETTI